DDDRPRFIRLVVFGNMKEVALLGGLIVFHLVRARPETERAELPVKPARRRNPDFLGSDLRHTGRGKNKNSKHGKKDSIHMAIHPGEDPCFILKVCGSSCNDLTNHTVLISPRPVSFSERETINRG